MKTPANGWPRLTIDIESQYQHDSKLLPACKPADAKFSPSIKKIRAESSNMNQEKACKQSSPAMATLQSAENPSTETDSPRVWESVELLAGKQEVLIRHHGEVYRLRLTRNDKLILNK